jgi:peroxin-19
VLDDFSGPKRPTTSAASSKPLDTQNNAAEEAFIKQLEADMLAQLMGGEASGKGKTPAPASAPKAESDTVEPNLPNLINMLQGMSEEDAAKYEEDMKKDGGMQNLFKNLLDSKGTDAGSSASASASAGVAGESFPDTIQKTLERMQESGEKITIEAKTSQDKLIDASIARLMEMVNETAANGGNFDVEQVFSDVIKEMSNKEMLYEPMKEYDAKYGPWLEENKATLSAEDYANYEKQAEVIKRIVETFESKDYSDDKSECLTSIWDLMQQVLLPWPSFSIRQTQEVASTNNMIDGSMWRSPSRPH